jgi:hypothetical protein
MGFSLKKLGRGALAIGTLGGSEVLNNVLNPKKPKQPNLPEPEVMPMVDEASQRKARRRSIAAQRARHGRASTILTADKETMG